MVIRPQKGRQEFALNIAQEKKVQFIIFGGAAGASKSRTLLMHPLLHMDDPNFGGVIFRRSKTSLDKPGMVWPESKKVYRDFYTKVNNVRKSHTFPSGAVVEFDGLKNVGDEIDKYHGAQLSFAGFDEGDHFEEEQVMFVFTRMRSDAKTHSYMFLTCNPNPDSWLLRWVEPYLDDDGYPIRELGGTIRYFLTVNNVQHFGATEDELIERFPNDWRIKADGKWVNCIASYTFIDGKIDDNPALLASNPQYLSNLKSKSLVEQERLIHGNWYIREEASGYWKREWCEHRKTPLEAMTCRAWDKAATPVSDVDPYPDFTASIKVSRCNDGFFYIGCDYHPDCRDGGSDIHGIFRKRSGERDRLILKQAVLDGPNTTIVLPVDPGGAGKTEYQDSARKLITHGFTVKPDPIPTQKGKLTKFSPFASACENGLVFIDKDSFPNEQTYEYFCKQLEAFDGSRSTRTRKDDLVDVVAMAFNFMNSDDITPNMTGSLMLGSQPTYANRTLNQFIPNFGGGLRGPR